MSSDTTPSAGESVGTPSTDSSSSSFARSGGGSGTGAMSARYPTAGGARRHRVELAPRPRIVDATTTADHWETSCASPSETRSEEHTSELQSLMRTSYAVFCLKKKNTKKNESINITLT